MLIFVYGKWLFACNDWSHYPYHTLKQKVSRTKNSIFNELKLIKIARTILWVIFIDTDINMMLIVPVDLYQNHIISPYVRRIGYVNEFDHVVKLLHSQMLLGSMVDICMSYHSSTLKPHSLSTFTLRKYKNIPFLQSISWMLMTWRR